MATKRHTHASHHEREEQEPQQEPAAPAEPAPLDIDWSTIRNQHEDPKPAPTPAPLGEVPDYAASPGVESVSVRANEHEDPDPAPREELPPPSDLPPPLNRLYLPNANELGTVPPSLFGTSLDPTPEEPAEV